MFYTANTAIYTQGGGVQDRTDARRAKEAILGNVLTKTTSVARSEGSKESFVPLKGVVIREMKRCGKPACRCSSGALHGPYHYRYYREHGRLRKRYVRPGDLRAIRERVETRRITQTERRVAKWQIRRMIAELKQAGLW